VRGETGEISGEIFGGTNGGTDLGGNGLLKSETNAGTGFRLTPWRFRIAWVSRLSGPPGTGFRLTGFRSTLWGWFR